MFICRTLSILDYHQCHLSGLQDGNSENRVYNVRILVMFRLSNISLNKIKLFPFHYHHDMSQTGSFKTNISTNTQQYPKNRYSIILNAVEYFGTEICFKSDKNFLSLLLKLKYMRSSEEENVIHTLTTI